jgi:spoIIIJ-associated protein
MSSSDITTDDDQTADAVTGDTDGTTGSGVTGALDPAAESDDSGLSAESDASDDSEAASELDEGDIAADYIEELLDILDLDGDIDIETRGGRSYISVDSAGENDLRVLSKPETVTALQELTRIAVQTRTGEFSRLILDVGGSRDTREQELTALVERAVAKIDEGASAASLPPMSSYERKLVHDIVAARGYASESEGEGRDRHTVVTRA